MIYTITSLSDKVKHCCSGLYASVANVTAVLSGKKRIAGISLLFLLLYGLQTKAQDLEWAKNMGGTTADEAFALAVDRSGNVYITGRFSGTADFDPGPDTAILRSAGSSDIFLAKYDNSGNFLWANGMGANGSDQGFAIALDTAGNVFITGQFQNIVDFNSDTGTATLASAGGADIFIAMYDTDGNYIWAKSAGGSSTDRGEAITVDRFGNVYITGGYNGTVDFDPGGAGTLTAVSGYDIFVAKYEANGNFVWVKSAGGAQEDNGQGIATDTAGNIYLTGYIQHIADFNSVSGNIPLTSAGAQDVFIAKYDTNGNNIWAKSMGGSLADFGEDIAVDSAGNIYITGYFQGTADFDPGTNTAELTSAGVQDIFVAKYDKDGNYVWAKRTGGSAADFGYAIALDAVGNIYTTGRFVGTVDFDPGPGTDFPTAMNSSDIFIVKYNNDGNYLWVKSMGGNGIDQGLGVVVDNRGNTYVAGSFNQAADFDLDGDGLMLTPTGGYDAFVFKLVCSDTTSSYYAATIECGMDYTLNGEVYNTDGTYTQIVHNTAGCDSTVMLNLTVLPVEEPVINVEGFVLGVSGNYASYQWIKNGIDIPGATEATYAVTENANYSVRVTNEYGCEVTSDIYPVTNVSINDVPATAGRISIFPNPVDDLLYINSPVPVNVNLCSIEGRSILFRSDVYTIPVKELPEGIYLLRITDRNGKLIKVEKVVKQ